VEFQDLQRHWEQFGREDPLWAILTDPKAKGNRWDLPTFFASGEVEVGLLLAHAEQVVAGAGGELRRGRALDFGCGVGRATQALATHFEACDGVDIASTMIEQAGRLNRFGDKVNYHLNQQADLSLFHDNEFDFVYTVHVLQHMEPRYAERYIREFHRIVRPGGVLMFEFVTEQVAGASAALPESACRADIEIVSAPTKVEPGEQATVSVRVRNAGTDTWAAAGTAGWFQVTVGNHWRPTGSDRSAVLVLDDAHEPLPADVPAGQSVDMQFDVHAPQAGGSYDLEIDLVQEGVAWFADRGSSIAKVPVAVRPTRRVFRTKPAAAGAATGDSPAIMEMHGIPTDSVRSWVAESGGEVLAISDFNEIVKGDPSLDWHRAVAVVRRAG
jgi:2-polyprenyl-3-methyl-5-hydroxy-6-metoxy-1,4-benzoquinol methylase